MNSLHPVALYQDSAGVSFQDVFLPVTDCKDVYLLEPWLQSLARFLGVSGSDVEGHDQPHKVWFKNMFSVYRYIYIYICI